MTNLFKLSALSAALFVGSFPAYSGQIIGVQQGTPSPVFSDAEEYKNGFGAWNLANINVRIVDANTKLVDITGKSYNPSDGSYTAMILGESFVSEVTDGAGTIMAKLTGKDWPTGEPSGIKVITTDVIEDQSNGRPNSCIMSTSYYKNSDDPKNYTTDPDTGDTTYNGPGLETDGLLDSTSNINATLCDSPFQTHKRIKVSALPASIDDTDGTANNGIDVVFNLDTANAASTDETALRRYTVLQKLNNYTASALQGFTIELGFGVGDSFTKIDTTNTALTDQLHLSIGDGTGDDFWAPDELAAFSAGLFGKANPPKHPEDGFFSDSAAGYEVTLTDAGSINSTSVLSTNYTDLFGNWIPSTVVPQGYFFDDDGDPLTDARLMAFWADDPATPEEDFKWLSGFADGFEPIEQAELDTWGQDPLYQEGEIEDLLNLGLSYMVEVGDVTEIAAQSGYSSFTIRMIPQVTVDIPAIVPPVVPPVVDTSTSGGSASFMSQFGFILMLLAFLGLGGWIVRNKMSK